MTGESTPGVLGPNAGLGAASEARIYPACKGRSCGCTDGRSHSAECQEEHDDAAAGVLGHCSVPMWMNGCPAGTCGHKAFGRVVPEPYYRNAWTGEERTISGRLRSYASGVACPIHGGPEAPNEAAQPKE